VLLQKNNPPRSHFSALVSSVWVEPSRFLQNLNENRICGRTSMHSFSLFGPSPRDFLEKRFYGRALAHSFPLSGRVPAFFSKFVSTVAPQRAPLPHMDGAPAIFLGRKKRFRFEVQAKLCAPRATFRAPSRDRGYHFGARPPRGFPEQTVLLPHTEDAARGLADFEQKEP
jgi:hypothetical protein